MQSNAARGYQFLDPLSTDKRFRDVLSYEQLILFGNIITGFQPERVQLAPNELNCALHGLVRFYLYGVIMPERNRDEILPPGDWL